ncbi:PepSY domain-containing protein [Labrenzia sp. PHM005]|uniref:PepSY-associated TM helix domain-containing protein n=1 Tax=Labrenzia sp. PHM005 TaxID=2590016 RepID=UPI0011407BE1|nr:PepSY domain-containing protein [Labrenzia sp. PHM005]QDG74559.1 PepSY domain-containing protein [Labrenzia sp. PHM005]
MTQNTQAADSTPSHSHFYLAAWRWHFYAGIFVVPFLIILAVTGMMMMYIGLFDGRDGERITVPVPANAEVLSVSDQASAAAAQIPGSQVIEWLKGRGAESVSVFRLQGETGQTMVAVNPYTGDVVETWVRRQGWYDFADSIHSDLLLGVTGDRLLEIAAGLSIVLIVTGIYLWWPRGGGVSKVLFPDVRQKGRALWRSLHSSIGIWLSAILLLFLITGMAWTGIWGSKLMQAWNTFPAEKWNNVPLSDDTHASMNHDAASDVPWALEQTPMPASGSNQGVTGTVDGVPVNIDSISNLAAAIGFNARYRIAYPKGTTGVWTINQDTMSSDAEDPFSDRTVHVDQFTGKILASVGFADYSLAAKAMAVGIPLHMGLVGLWNLILNTIACLSVIFLCISGVVMWWIRRPKGAALRIVAPKTPEDLPHWRGAMILMLFLSLAFPLVGITLLTVLALDYLLVKRIPVLRKAIG